MADSRRKIAIEELNNSVKETIVLEVLNLFKSENEINELIKDAIMLETLRIVKNNMSVYMDKMLDVCTYLNKTYGFGADRIEKILDDIEEENVFYRMHDKEYAYWIQLGVKCQKYSDRRQAYIAKHLDDLK